MGDATAVSPVYGEAGSSNLSQPYEIGYRLQNEPRDYVLDHDSFKMDEGFKGNIDDTWSYDVYAQYGQSSASRHDRRRRVEDEDRQRPERDPERRSGAECACAGGAGRAACR